MCAEVKRAGYVRFARAWSLSELERRLDTDPWNFNRLVMKLVSAQREFRKRRRPRFYRLTNRMVFAAPGSAARSMGC